MRKLTAMVVASTLAMGTASFAFAADTTTANVPSTTDHMNHVTHTDHATHTSHMTHTSHATHRNMMCHNGEHDHSGMYSGLSLTDVQLNQMKDLMKESDMVHQHGETMSQMDALHKLVATDSFDEAKVKSQIDQMTQTHSAYMLEHAKAENKMYNLLTPEQKKIFNENYQRCADRMSEKMAEHQAHQTNTRHHSAN